MSFCGRCVRFMRPPAFSFFVFMLLTVLLASFLTFVELNCENLFDCQHDSMKNDREFLPDSPRQWKQWKYWRKLDRLSKEIMACGEDSTGYTLPDIVALCEVENDSVMRDLTRRSSLRVAGYDYLMTNSPDERGIDVALMYHRFSFAPIVHRSIRVAPITGMHPTRDILYVSGQIITGDTLHIFVVHAPSRYGGERATRPFRLAVAEHLCSAIDSVRTVSKRANIIVAGDFNDSEDGKSLAPYYEKGLHNVTRAAKGCNGAKATYRYRGKWERIDHVLFSAPLLQCLRSAVIFDATFLLIDDEKYGGVKPRRTFPPYRYDADGYSDHLPLVVRLSMP